MKIILSKCRVFLVLSPVLGLIGRVLLYAFYSKNYRDLSETQLSRSLENYIGKMVKFFKYYEMYSVGTAIS